MSGTVCTESLAKSSFTKTNPKRKHAAALPWLYAQLLTLKLWNYERFIKSKCVCRYVCKV